MDQYRQTAQTWDKLAQAYQDKFMDLDLYDHTYDAFCDALPDPHSRGLDMRLHAFHVPYEKSEGQMETHTALIFRQQTQ